MGCVGGCPECSNALSPVCVGVESRVSSIITSHLGFEAGSHSLNLEIT